MSGSYANDVKIHLPSGLGFGYDDWLYNQQKQREIYNNEYNAINAMKSGYSSFLANQGRSMNPARSWLAYDNQLSQLQNNIRMSEFQSYNSLGQTLGLTNGYGALGLFKIGKISRWL